MKNEKLSHNASVVFRNNVTGETLLEADCLLNAEVVYPVDPPEIETEETMHQQQRERILSLAQRLQKYSQKTK